MPDVTRKTISATEMSGLLGVSPYLTRWMLWQKFAKGIEPAGPDHNRLDWGTKMEPLLLEQAAADLRLEVTTNRQPDGSQVYVRRGLLGCSAMRIFTILSVALAPSKPSAVSTTKF